MRRWVGRLLAACMLVCVFSSSTVGAESVLVTIGVGDTILSITGQTSPNAFVTVAKNGSTIGTTTAATNGTYSILLPAQEPGIYTYDLSADSQQNVHTDMVHITANIAEHTTTNLYAFLPSTVQLTSPSPAYGQPLVVKGETLPDAQVLVYIDDVIYTTVTADSAGIWNTTVSTASLASGNHQLFVQAVDLMGELSYPSAARTIMVAAEPSRPIEQPAGINPGSSPDAPDTPVITYPPSGIAWTQPTIVIRGTAAAGTQVELWDGDQIIGSAWANTAGEWQLPLYLGKKAYDLRAQACRSGICSGFSPAVRFRYLPKQPQKQPLSVRVPQSRFTIIQHEQLTIRAVVLDGRGPYTTTVYWGDGERSDATSSNQHITQKHVYKQSGKFVVRLLIEDNTGRSNTVYYTVEVQPDKGWQLPLRAILIFILLATIGWWFVAWKRRRKKRQPATKKARAAKGKRSTKRKRR